MKVLLDTNFLLYAAKHKVDYSESGDLFTLSLVVDELDNLKNNARKIKDRDAAALALKLLKASKVKILKAEGSADKVIIKRAEEFDVVATMDKELKKKLKGKARILTIKGKKKLEIL